MSTVTTRRYHDIRRALLAQEELALIDVREEDPFAQGHPLFAANIPLTKLELEIFARVPPVSYTHLTLPTTPYV